MVRRCCSAILVTLAFSAAALASKPLVTFKADDIIYAKRPGAAITRWTAAPGRHTVALAVPGATLRGFSYAGRSPKAPILLFFGGNGYPIALDEREYRLYTGFVSRVVTYDYRGYGFSTGRAHFADFGPDAVRIYDAVSKHGRPVAVLGYSMGTGVAEYLAMRRPVRMLVLCAPYIDVAAVMNSYDPKHSYVLAPDAVVLFNTAAMVKKIDAPLLVLQGTRDDLIPPVQGPALERVAASPDKRFVPIVGAKHDGLLGNHQTLSAVRAFLARWRAAFVAGGDSPTS